MLGDTSTVCEAGWYYNYLLGLRDLDLPPHRSHHLREISYRWGGATVVTAAYAGRDYKSSMPMRYLFVRRPK